MTGNISTCHSHPHVKHSLLSACPLGFPPWWFELYLSGFLVLLWARCQQLCFIPSNLSRHPRTSCSADRGPLGWGGRGGGATLVVTPRPAWGQGSDLASVLEDGQTGVTYLQTSDLVLLETLTIVYLTLLESIKQLRSIICGHTAVLSHPHRRPVRQGRIGPRRSCWRLSRCEFRLHSHVPLASPLFCINRLTSHLLSKEVRSFYKHLHSNFLHVLSDYKTL